MAARLEVRQHDSEKHADLKLHDALELCREVPERPEAGGCERVSQLRLLALNDREAAACKVAEDV